MGCKQSVQVQTQKQPPQKIVIQSNELMSGASSANNTDPHPCMTMFNVFRGLMKGVSRLPLPEELVPVICLTDFSFPLAIQSFICESDDTSQTFPVLGISEVPGGGRITCIGHIDLLADCKPENAEYLAFLENLLQYLAGPRPPSSSVCLLAIKPQVMAMLHQNISGLGYQIETKSKPVNLEKYCIIITTSDVEFGEEIKNYIKNGGGLICCAPERYIPNQFRLNRILTSFGLGFLDINFSLPLAKKNTMRTNYHANEMERFSFPYLSERFIQILDEPHKIENIDEIIVSLRFQCNCLEISDNPFAAKVAKKISEYLDKKIEVNEEEEFFIDKESTLVIYLLADLMNKVDPHVFESTVQNKFNVFPGWYSTVKPSDYEIKAGFRTNCWFSTGLYLPPGSIGQLECEDSLNDYYLQIGAHAQNIFEKETPLKRFPFLVQRYNLQSKTLDFSSPFGGILYIITENYNPSNLNRFKLHFSNVVRYPYFRGQNTGAEFTDNDPPWCELQTTTTCFTLPTIELRKIDDINRFSNFFDNLVKKVLVFIGFKLKRRFRIVFDIEIPEEGSDSSYPIYFSIDSIPEIMFIDEPTSDLFAILMMIAIVSLPDGSLDPNVEAALGALIVSHVFVTTWPKISPSDYTYLQYSPIFQDFWDLHLHNDKKIISTALTRFCIAQTEHSTSHEESIKYIVDEMSTIAEKDFSYLLKNALHPSATSSTNLPVYSFEPEEPEKEKQKNPDSPSSIEEHFKVIAEMIRQKEKILNEKKAELDELNGDNQDVLENIDKKNEIINKMKEDKEQLQRQFEHYSIIKEKNKETLDHESQTIINLKNHILEMVENIKNSRKELFRLQHLMEKSEQPEIDPQIIVNESKIIELQQIIEASANKLEELKNTESMVIVLVQEVKKECDKVSQQTKSQIKQEHDKKIRELKEFQSSKNTLEEQIHILEQISKDQIERICREIQQLEQEEPEYDNIPSKIASYKGEIKSTENEIIVLRSELEEAEKKDVDLRNYSQKLYMIMENKEKELKNQIHEFEVLLRTKANEQNKKQNQLQIKKKANHKRKARIKDLEQQMKSNIDYDSLFREEKSKLESSYNKEKNLLEKKLDKIYSEQTDIDRQTKQILHDNDSRCTKIIKIREEAAKYTKISRVYKKKLKEMKLEKKRLDNELQTIENKINEEKPIKLPRPDEIPGIPTLAPPQKVESPIPSFKKKTPPPIEVKPKRSPSRAVSSEMDRVTRDLHGLTLLFEEKQKEMNSLEAEQEEIHDTIIKLRIENSNMKKELEEFEELKRFATGFNKKKLQQSPNKQPSKPKKQVPPLSRIEPK